MTSQIRVSISGILWISVLVASQLTIGCRGEPKVSKPAPQQPAKANSARFAEPNLAAETFIGAAAAADVRLIRLSLSEHCEPEFRGFLDLEPSEEQLKELSATFANARVGTVTKDGDTAFVEIILVDGSETLEMIQTSDGWRVIGF